MNRARPAGGSAPLRPWDPRRIGPYTVLGRLGAGGTGEVYLGRDRAAGRAAIHVAIKMVHEVHAADPDFRRRFAREVAIARSVQAPWTAPVLDADPDAEHPWLATAYVDGPTLGAAVGGGGPLGESTVRVLGARLAAAVAALHAHGVVHRDITPSNILLAGDGPRLIDFGISRAVDATALTQTGVLLGTPAYLSPEQAAGEPAEPASDVFALGAVLVFAAAGKPPFGSGVSPVAVLRRIVDDPPDLAGVPTGLAEQLVDCLAKNPDERPTATDLIDRLGPADGSAVPWRAPAARPEPRHRISRRTLLRGGGAAVGVAGLAGIAIRIAGSVPASAEPPAGRAADVAWTHPAEPGTRLVTVGLVGDVVVVDDERSVLGLDALSGRLRWRVPVRAWSFRQSFCAGGSYYSGGYTGEGGDAIAVDAITGQVRWEHSGATIIAADPSIAIGIVMDPLDYESPREVLGLDPADGTIRWRLPIPQDEAAYKSTTALTPGRVHLGFRWGMLTVDAASGAPLWTLPGDRHDSSVATDSGIVLIGRRSTAALDARSGAVLWDRADLVPDLAWPVAVSHGDTAYQVTQYRVTAFDVATGDIRWTRGPEDLPRPGTVFHPHPGAVGDRLYLGRIAAYGSAAAAVEILALRSGDGVVRDVVSLPGRQTTTGRFGRMVASPDTVFVTVVDGVHAVRLGGGD